MARVFVTRQLPGPALERLNEHHDVEIWPEDRPPSYYELTKHVAEAEGLIALPGDCVDAELIAGSPRLRAIATYAVGYDNVDLAAASSRNIAVGNTPDVLTNATADLTITILLAAARQLPQALAAARDGHWTTWRPAGHLGVELDGAVLGIVGMGRIGSAVAARARGFGMQIAQVGSKSTDQDLDELLARSDFVSLHVPLTDRTHHIINAQTLARMKPTAFLVNTGRGGLVDQAALIDALNANTIAGAALDVTDPEPPAPDDPILSAPNLVLTPHIGSATQTAREKMAELAVDNLLAGLEGRPMPHQVDQPA